MSGPAAISNASANTPRFPPVNLILFEPAEIGRPLPRTDRRAQHLLNVLRTTPGTSFDAGIVDGPRGKGTLVAESADSLTLSFTWDAPTPAAAELVHLIVGLPRPQTARDILRDAASLGVAALHFVSTEKGERSYAQSTLWSSGEWRRHLITGAEQAFTTQLPPTTFGRPLADILASLDPDTARVALDNYEATMALGDWPIIAEQPVVLAIGPERGWSDDERTALRTHCFGLAHLGPRVLRTETATIAALSIVRSKLGLM